MHKKKLWVGTLCGALADGDTCVISRSGRSGATEAADMIENEIATSALDICFAIHRQYGPGLFESVYEEIFCHEWAKQEFLSNDNKESR